VNLADAPARRIRAAADHGARRVVCLSLRRPPLGPLAVPASPRGTRLFVAPVPTDHVPMPTPPPRMLGVLPDAALQSP
jgi:hypothetical protein